MASERAGDTGWSARRALVVGLLAESDRLSALTELVGVDALPGRERMVVLGGRLVREAVLQQSSLSATDAYCARGQDGRAGGRCPGGGRSRPGDRRRRCPGPDWSRNWTSGR